MSPFPFVLLLLLVRKTTSQGPEYIRERCNSNSSVAAQANTCHVVSVASGASWLSGTTLTHDNDVLQLSAVQPA